MPNVPSESSALLIEQTLGAVLSAVVKAQALAASTFAQIVQAVGFEDDPASPGALRARTFEFGFSRPEADPANDTISDRPVRATMPLLSIMNLPSIAVDEATLEMDVRIVAHSVATDDPGPPFRVSPAAGLSIGQLPAKIFVTQPVVEPLSHGSGAPPAAPSGNVHVKVTMRRQEQPGLDQILRVLRDTYREEELP